MKIAFLIHCNSLVFCKVHYGPSKKSHKAKSFCQQLNNSEINYAISQTGFAESRACFFLSMLMDSLSIKQKQIHRKTKTETENQKHLSVQSISASFVIAFNFEHSLA